MAAVAWALGVYLVVALLVAIPFAVVGWQRIRDRQSRLGWVLVGWAALVVLLPVVATSCAYAFGLREATFTEDGEAWPTWALVFPLTAMTMLGGTFVWFLAWVVAWGVRPENER